jgi:orotate phosphoribosyltransferase-like protein
MGRMTKGEREEKISVKGKSYTDIAEDLDVSRPTATKLVEDALAVGAEHRSVEKEREKAIATYRAVIDEGWSRLGKLKDARSYNVSGLLNSIKAAQESIDNLSGAKAPAKIQHVNDTYEIVFEDDDLIEADLDRDA